MFKVNDIKIKKTQGKQQVELYFHNPLFLEHSKNYVSLKLLVYNVFIR